MCTAYVVHVIICYVTYAVIWLTRGHIRDPRYVCFYNVAGFVSCLFIKMGQLSYCISVVIVTVVCFISDSVCFVVRYQMCGQCLTICTASAFLLLQIRLMFLCSFLRQYAWMWPICCFNSVCCKLWEHIMLRSHTHDNSTSAFAVCIFITRVILLFTAAYSLGANLPWPPSALSNFL